MNIVPVNIVEKRVTLDSKSSKHAEGIFIRITQQKSRFTTLNYEVPGASQKGQNEAEHSLWNTASLTFESKNDVIFFLIRNTA